MVKMEKEYCRRYKIGDNQATSHCLMRVLNGSVKRACWMDSMMMAGWQQNHWHRRCLFHAAREARTVIGLVTDGHRRRFVRATGMAVAITAGSQQRTSAVRSTMRARREAIERASRGRAMSDGGEALAAREDRHTHTIQRRWAKTKGSTTHSMTVLARCSSVLLRACSEQRA